ncbi:ROK family protein [Pedobacter sp. SYP-B3415]|uniref:ROK family protein n=1 Tax=Pedobacter sp. SYP-B3415 TaxID=2496641 RepID=UPI00101DBD26|nr:ROK family protein [Pedobacter sp. SYP-B3415]
MSNTDQQPVIGVDIGGSHLTAAVVDNGIILPQGRSRIKVNPHAPAAEIFDLWAKCLTEVSAVAGLRLPKIGIAMPGPFEYAAGISRIRGLNKYESLYGINVKNELAGRLQLPAENLIFINDAEAFLLGEVYAGSGAGFDRVIGITLGTGLGSASALDGVVKDENRAVVPYLDSFAEAYISTRGLTGRFEELTGLACKDLKAIITLDNHQKEVREVFSEFTVHLENFLSDFISDTRAEVVVIGGNIARADSWFLPELQNRLRSRFPGTSLRLTELWEDAALVGATAVFAEKYSRSEIQNT